MAGVYYNDNDKFAAEWLRELIKVKLIPEGDVDERSIKEICGDDLRKYHQCHFFAGIGGWALALQLAGWEPERPVWTGSCPCQPFSQAGLQRGIEDPRHLWPDFLRLISEGKPPTVFGEQVASKAGREWLAGVRADMEALVYDFGAADLCAPSKGAPHIRQRLYWMADTEGAISNDVRAFTSWEQSRFTDNCGVGVTDGAGSQPGLCSTAPSRQGNSSDATGGDGIERLDDTTSARRALSGSGQPCESEARSGGSELGCEDSQWLGSPNHSRSQGWGSDARQYTDQRTPWAGSIFIDCSDGKQRRVPATEAADIEPTLFPLVDAGSFRNRVGALRGSGNAIVPALAAEFIEASREAIDLWRV